MVNEYAEIALERTEMILSELENSGELDAFSDEDIKELAEDIYSEQVEDAVASDEEYEDEEYEDEDEDYEDYEDEDEEYEDEDEDEDEEEFYSFLEEYGENYSDVESAINDFVELTSDEYSLEDLSTDGLEMLYADTYGENNLEDLQDEYSECMDAEEDTYTSMKRKAMLYAKRGLKKDALGIPGSTMAGVGAGALLARVTDKNRKEIKALKKKRKAGTISAAEATKLKAMKKRRNIRTAIGGTIGGGAAAGARYGIPKGKEKWDERKAKKAAGAQNTNNSAFLNDDAEERSYAELDKRDNNIMNLLGNN